VPRILLVDDDRDHLELFTMILENRGFTLDAYSDSVAALSKFKPHYYDLLLLDYRMPNLNGLELYTRIRELDPRSKALLLTATHEQFTESKQKVGKDYLRVITKPISNEELLSEVNFVLNQPVTSMVSLESYPGIHQNFIANRTQKRQG
jgi:DNA-binding response OmpR family regulator